MRQQLASRSRRTAVVAVALLSLSLTSCETWGLTAIRVFQPILRVAALNYGGDYATEIAIVVDALSQASQVALASYLQAQEQEAQEAAAGPPAIAMNVALMKRLVTPMGIQMQAIAEGEVLRDGRGTPAQGDQFRMFFSPSVDCYVYIVSVDATGWMEPLFPFDLEEIRPIPGGETYLLPDESHWYGLDENQGFEHIYFMASYERQLEFEERLKSLAGQTRAPLEKPALVSKVERVEQPWLDSQGPTSRGLGSPSTIQTRDISYRVEPTVFSFGVPGRDFVLTRTFEHR